MRSPVRFILICFASIVFVLNANAQVDEMCTEAGFIPSLDSPFAHVPYVFGRVTLKGVDPVAKLPSVSVTLTDSQQPANRFMLGRSGNYCFKRTGGGGTLVVQVDGIEAARRTLPSMGSSQQREILRSQLANRFRRRRLSRQSFRVLLMKRLSIFTDKPRSQKKTKTLIRPSGS